MGCNIYLDTIYFKKSHQQNDLLQIILDNFKVNNYFKLCMVIHTSIKVIVIHELVGSL